MNKWIFGLMLLPFLLVACQAKQKGMKASQKNAMVDSIVGVKMEELNRQAMEDLDRRMAIEVKAKADSIVQSKQHPPVQGALPPGNPIIDNTPVQ